MNTHSWTRWIGILSLLWGLAPAHAAGDPETKEIMQLKLGNTQAVLRGLALQNFGVVETNAGELVKLSKLSGWRARQTPEYELFSLEFRRRAEDLVAAAKSKNVDATTLAYTQLTISCVSCHKYLRDGSVQKVSLPSRAP